MSMVALIPTSSGRQQSATHHSCLEPGRDRSGPAAATLRLPKQSLERYGSPKSRETHRCPSTTTPWKPAHPRSARRR
jgi:hypothetical protein